MLKRSLKPCPDKPNCVSSLSGDHSHTVEPLRYSSDWQAVKKSLLDVIAGTPRAAVVEDCQEYIHAVFKSRIFGFTDDVEFVFDDTRKVIHIRSASRLGYYDFGVNRRRVRILRARLTASPS